MARKVEMVLEYQNYIETPPVTPKQMYQAACSADVTTMDHWREIWIRNALLNHKKFGSFKEKSLGKLFNSNLYKPAVIVGSGPSLGYNGEALKDKRGILALSCLHNYHYFEDRNIEIDYFVTLDAGPVVTEEVYEGGKKTPEEYWESTKDKKLIAFIGTDPKLFELWQGEVYLFTAPIGDPKWQETMRNLESFHVTVSNGGNVLGACLYIAKAIMGSNPIAFVGADFCFGTDQGKGHKFHSWESKYDAKLGNVQRAFDVFGNKALTWPSYFNFKNFFDSICLTVKGLYINCTEGGLLGAYPEGNLMAIKQMPLSDFLLMYHANDALSSYKDEPEKFNNIILY